jgi:hypothetical protein
MVFVFCLFVDGGVFICERENFVLPADFVGLLGEEPSLVICWVVVQTSDWHVGGDFSKIIFGNARPRKVIDIY